MPAQKLELSRRDWMIAVLQAGSVLGAAPLAAGVPPAWLPSFLSVRQNETLVALGERIIPGSSQALCNRLIDFVLPIEGDKNRIELLQSLAAFDRQRFQELSPGQQDEILTVAERGGSLHTEFGVVKQWMADAYWSSLNGQHELGWTGRMAWESFPDCGGHQSAQ
jgi:hypothetical protein